MQIVVISVKDAGEAIKVEAAIEKMDPNFVTILSLAVMAPSEEGVKKVVTAALNAGASVIQM